MFSMGLGLAQDILNACNEGYAAEIVGVVKNAFGSW